jgi:hypothetical protein
MKFAMYLIDIEDGSVVGTNDVEQVLAYFAGFGEDRYIVIHSTNGDWAIGSNDTRPIKALTPLYYEEDEDDEEQV